MKHKSIKPWVILLTLPIPLLVINAVIQAVVRASNQGNSNVLINIFSLLVGIGAVLMLLGLPIWIIMLVKTTNYNKNLTPEVTDKPPASPQPPNR